MRVPKPIGDEVRRQLGRFGPAGGMAGIVRAWPGAVGDEIARNAWPARVARDGTLHVSTSSSAWAFELGLLEQTILPRLRESLGDLAPPRLRFAAGPLPEPPVDEPSGGAQRPPEPSTLEVEQAASAAASIEDENLRKLVARAAAVSLARGR